MERRSSLFAFLISCFLILFASRTTNAQNRSIETDRLALERFRLAVDPTGTHLQWNSSTNPCFWNGIQCYTNRVAVVRLANFNFAGSLPANTLADLDQLRILSLHHNSFTGPFPADLSQCLSLRSLFLRNNFFSGELPDFSGIWPRLSHFDVAFNNFTGQIPVSITSLTNLLVLELQNNAFTGRIPAISVPLLRFSVANNQLTGQIPPTLQFFPKSSFTGNNLLCGPPTSILCSTIPPISPPIPSPVSSPMASPVASPIASPVASPIASPIASPVASPIASPIASPAKMSVGAVVGVAAGAFVVLLALIIFFLCCFCHCRRRGGSDDDDNEEFESGPGKHAAHSNGKRSMNVVNGVHRVHGERGVQGVNGGELGVLGELGLNAEYGDHGEDARFKRGLQFLVGGRHEFTLEELLQASAEVLGRGSMGTSYKAEMSASVVVVKRLKEVVAEREEFGMCLAVLGRLRHRHLLPLRACYFSRDEKLLVTDFIARGSLASVLHGERQGDRPVLDWVSRAKIALGSARALAFLHKPSVKVVHGDVTSSNVLLGRDWEPLLADYGLTPLLSPVSFAASRFLAYRASEVSQLRHVSLQSDVYSFGVVLLELITGKAPRENSKADTGVDLPRWITSIPREDWRCKAIDPELMKCVGEEQDEHEVQMLQMLQLGVACVDRIPERRPKMDELVLLLEDITQLETRNHGDPNAESLSAAVTRSLSQSTPMYSRPSSGVFVVE